MQSVCCPTAVFSDTSSLSLRSRESLQQVRQLLLDALQLPRQCHHLTIQHSASTADVLHCSQQHIQLFMLIWALGCIEKSIATAASKWQKVGGRLLQLQCRLLCSVLWCTARIVPLSAAAAHSNKASQSVSLSTGRLVQSTVPKPISSAGHP